MREEERGEGRGGKEMEALTKDIQSEFLAWRSSIQPSPRTHGHLKHSLGELVAALALCLEDTRTGLAGTRRASGNTLYVCPRP